MRDEQTITATWLGIALALAIPLISGVVAYGRLTEQVDIIREAQAKAEIADGQHKRDDSARVDVWVAQHQLMAERITRLEEGRQRNADALAALTARVDHLNAELDNIIRGNK